MPVNNLHPKYSLYLPTWEKTRDAVCGSVAIKDKGSIYLPIPNESDKESSARYKQYKKRAVYANFTARTKNALVGAAFRQDPELDFPVGLEYLEYDSTGEGLDFAQMAKDSLSNVLEVGRQGFLVDYPQAGDNLTDEDVSMLDLRANIVPYTAESIINWKTSAVNGRNLLTLVVLSESYGDGEDEFSQSAKTQHRVLRLDEIGYSQQIYRDNTPYSEMVYARDATGAIWQEIPFIFCGSKNNDSTIDDAPLADIAEVNIAHYRNSADYEEGLFIHGQPMLHIDVGTMSADEWDKLNPAGVVVGSRRAITTNGGGTASLLQAESNGAAHEGMIAKEQQMIMIGARIITDRGGQETAEAARIRFSSENSVLGDVVKNLGQALTQCVEWCGMFMGALGEASVTLNTNFYDKSLDPQMVMSLIQAYDRQAFGMVDLRMNLRRAGFIESEDDELDQEVGQADPLV